MKIHRIEVRNLNSLHGDQAVDLDEDLGGSSIFLIQGPTGAGKSTLMDAVSLALFGATPRLDTLRSESAVAEQVMSRGEGDARAGLVFSKWEASMSRRVRYRATWSARRARGRPQGAIQAPERSLERLEESGEWTTLISDTRGRFLAPVFESVLERFTIQDFQRSMLLAQGRFDSLLRAGPEERAAILERLTNTAEYAEIGLRAARVAAAWRARVGQRENEHRQVGDVDASRVEALRTTIQAVEAERTRLTAELQVLDAFQAWLARRGLLSRQVSDASKDLETVLDLCARRAPEFEALAEHERCAEAFPVLDRLDGVVERIGGLLRARSEAQESLPQRLEAERRGLARLEASRAAATRAREALEALRLPCSELAEARRLVGSAKSEQERARSTHAAAQGSLAEETRSLGALTHKLARDEDELRKTSARREALAEDARFESLLPSLDAMAGSVRSEQSSIEGQVRHLAREDAELALEGEALARDASRLAEEARTTLAQIEAEALSCRKALGVLVGDNDPDALIEAWEHAREAMSGTREALDRARQEMAERDGAAADAEQRCEALAKLDLDLASAGALHERAESDEQAMRAGVEHARAARDPLERIAALGQQREALGDDEPCPLCGSRSHPYKGEPSERARLEALEGELAAARRRVVDAESALEAQQAACRRARDRLLGLGERRRTAATEHERAIKNLEERRIRLERALQSSGLGVTSSASDLTLGLQGVDARRQEFAQRLTKLREARKAESTARERLEATHLTHERSERSLAERRGRLDERMRARERYAALLADTRAELAERRRTLADTLAPFGILADPPEDGVAEARVRFGACQDAVQAEGLALNRRNETRERIRAGEEARAKAEGHLAEATASLEERKTVLERTQRAEKERRDALVLRWGEARVLDVEDLPGRPPLPLEESRALELQGAWVRQLDIRVDAALKEVERARAELQKHQGHLESLDGALGEARAEEASLRLLLERHLGMLGLTDLTILRASRLSPALLQPTREARQDLDGRVHHARAMAQAATRALEEHEAAQPSPHPEDEAPERLQDLRTATETGLRELDERGDALRAERLEMDHRAQEKARAKASLDETRARAEVWLKLHDLIGRGDGKHFRQFAQALNLGQLLARANMHLARFSGRYALRSELDPETGLPTLEFEIVDRFRPGMPRSPRTLSGGESFLVSLALALGLADLRTSSMPVETLMLDEGFGTLDRNTLHGALAALQQLRASGRQIGIISHVSSLEDLIEDRVLVEPIGEGHSRVRVFRGPAVSRAS